MSGQADPSFSPADRFRALFDALVVPVFEQDASDVRREFDRLVAAGVEDLAAYYKTRHSEFLDLLRGIRIVAANRAIFNLFGVEDLENLKVAVAAGMAPPSVDVLVDNICAMVRSDSMSSLADVTVTLPSGRSVEVIATSVVVSGSESSWERIVVSFDDQTLAREADSARREREAIFRTGFDCAPVGIFQSSPSGHIVTVNARACEILGYRAEELIGLTWQELTHADDFAMSNELAKRFFSGEIDSVSVEKRYRRKDGSFVPISIAINAIREKCGAVRFFVAVIDDITSRQAAVSALAESEARYRALVDSAAVGVSVQEGDRQIYMNHALSEIFGYGPGDPVADIFANTTDLGNVAPWSRSAVKERQSRLAAGRPVPLSIEIDIMRKDGSVGTVEVTSTPFTVGDKAYRQAIFLDITQRKQAELALLESESRHRGLVENSIVAVAIIDPPNFVYANRAFRDLLGFESEEELFSRPLADYLNPCSVQSYEENLQHFWNREPLANNVVYEVVCRDGRVKTVEIGASYLEMGGRMLMQVVCVDRTQRVLAETALRASREQIRALAEYSQVVVEEERKAIAREIHDVLGQGLMAIKMDAAAIASGLRRDQKGLKATTDGLLRYIDEIVGVVQRVTAELRPGVLDDLGLGAALEWLGGDFARRSGLSCQVTVQPPDAVLGPTLSIALYRIAQEALTNVARHSGAKSVKVHLDAAASEVRMEILDDGIGIDPAKAEDFRSFGLIGMRERLIPFAGKVVVLRCDEGGTIVNVRVPVEAEG